jgi:CRISPR-associated protein Csd2
MSSQIKRATGLLVIEAVNSNPNGDPYRENEPRQRPNGRGEISPVSFKRKLRDLLEDADSPFFQSLPKKFSSDSERYRILESRGRKLDDIKKELPKDTAKFNEPDFLKSDFVRNYWDARIFGNTFLDGKGSGQKIDKGFIKTGVVQFGVGVSVAPINVIRHTNTQKRNKKRGKENENGMAPLAFCIVQHGVYAMPFFVNPNYAHKSGCTADDIELLKLLIPQAYDLNRSAIRPDVRIRHAWYIEHKNALGSCPDYLLLEALTPTRIDDESEPSTSWSNYADKIELPSELSQRVACAVDLMAL